MATLRDIAEATGFSVTVVSRALGERTSHLVAEETRNRIREVAARLSYSPNRMASCLKRGLGPSLGFFLPTYNPELVQPLLQGLTEEANREGFSYSVSFDISGERLFELLTQTERTKNVGIVTYLPADVSRSPIPPLLKRLTRQGTSVVVINSPLPAGVSLPHLDINNELGGHLAAERLISTGCVRLLTEGSAVSHQFGARLRGFRAAADAAGLPCRSFCLTSGVPASPIEALPPLMDELSHGPYPVGLSTNDSRAMLVHGELCRRGMGGMLGQEIRLIGFNNLPYCDHLHPRLTSITNPMRELGAVAAQLLFNQILGEDRPVDRSRLQPKLVIRETA
jgi:LacI family transcriptional regulator